MAVSSEVDIMNSALIKIGGERIITADDDSNRARLVKQQYPVRRDKLLYSHPWKFATARVALAPLATKPSEFWDFDYVYQLPADCLRVTETSLEPVCPWSIEQNKYLACNDSSIFIKYVRRITDVSKFDDAFVECLAWDLAADIAYALTQSTAQKQAAEQSAQRELMVARSFNAQQGSVQRVSADEVLNSRYY